MDLDLLGKLVATAPGVVGIIIVVILFLKALGKHIDRVQEMQKDFITQVRDINQGCHDRTREDRESFQEQMSTLVERHEQMAGKYAEAMQEFGAAIGNNGKILERVETALYHTHRRENDPHA